MKFEHATAEVEQLILARFVALNPDVKEPRVGLNWWDPKTDATIGARVSGVSFLWGDAGISYRQSEPQGLVFCALAERAVLNRMFGADYEKHYADDTLLEALGV